MPNEGHGQLHRWAIAGQVQGVGFRPLVWRVAHELGLTGRVWNDAAGVTVEALGGAGNISQFEGNLRAALPPLARIDDMDHVVAEAAASFPSSGFHIVESDAAGSHSAVVTIDTATCAACLAELVQGADSPKARDRRYGHALINCTHCGPRYTIQHEVPYDRASTTMASFPMCAKCEAEYRNPSDRRFHAQPVACHDCGPKLELLDGTRREASAPDSHACISGAADAIQEGSIVGIKGLGGFHLAVDATNEAAVRELRRRKGRESKPLALGTLDLAEARALIQLSPAAADLFASPIAPIVIANTVTPAHHKLAPSLAPGEVRLGVMRASTPLLVLLFAELRERGFTAPLVLTSANLSSAPLATEASQLCVHGARTTDDAPLADFVLTHNRPIARAVDDSVVLDAPAGLLPLRRARGFAPASIALPRTAARAGLCTGAELKNTIAVVPQGGAPVLSQHIGDLADSLSLERFQDTIADMQRLFAVAPEWIACDAHPSYISSRSARKLAREGGLELIEVQHHHAHLAALLAEHGRSERIVGVVCDGAGWGDDGTIWGGEILVGDCASYQRAARLRPLRLLGGDAAAKETGRVALAWLADALDGSRLDTFAARAITCPKRRKELLWMLKAQVNAPESSSLGRLFDGAAALLGVCEYNHHEAQSGMALEALASQATQAEIAKAHREAANLLPPTPAKAGLIEIDHRPLLLALLDGLEAQASRHYLARLFHEAIAQGFSLAALQVAQTEGLTLAGLTGGVFCNALLAQLVQTQLEEAGLEVLLHRTVPTNDGGIAFGQAAVAATVL